MAKHWSQMTDEEWKEFERNNPPELFIKNSEFLSNYLKEKIPNQKIRKNHMYRIEDIYNWCYWNYIDLEQYIKEHNFDDEFLLKIIY